MTLHRPGLGFGAYAEALAGIVAHSRAEFAVGIFGTWGSGKTTLMRAIEDRLKPQSDIVTVWFTAWRYEKEEHLIVPLLDVLREELERRAVEEAAAGQAAASPTRRAAEAVARAGRAFLAGVKLSAKAVGVEASWEPAKTIEALQSDEIKASDPLSFYHAAFVMLRQAISDFSAGGSRRIVVFVDDLDRCLPANALDVLESMKLFSTSKVLCSSWDWTTQSRSLPYCISTPNRTTDSLNVTGAPQRIRRSAARTT